MELLEGETLTERLKRGRLHPLRALQYGYDVACGLDAAHEIGVVHRDVKPDNLFVTREGVVKILDFTAAKFFLAGLRTTEPAARVGTVAFMSPESLEGATTDARLDQYSLALCIYCMLTGKHPFARHMANQYAMMRAHSGEKPEPLARVAGLPSWIDDVLAPALAKDVEKRYPTMAHFAQAIRDGMIRLAREIKEGVVVVTTPLGDPPIDVELDEDTRPSQRVYVAPEEVVRQVTAPVMPGERVSVAPDALPDAPTSDTDPFDTAETAPLPASTTPATEKAPPAPQHRTTTAPVPPMMTTTPVRRPPRPRKWIAALAVALALPAVGGLGWRWRAQATASHLAAAAEPSTTAEAPDPTAAPTVAAEPPPREEPPVAPAPSPQPPAAPIVKVVRPPPSAVRLPKAEPVLVEAPAPAPPPAPSPPPTATAAPHRVFGSEN